MSDDRTQVQDTQHAFLVAWGWFAEHMGWSTCKMSADQRIHWTWIKPWRKPGGNPLGQTIQA